MTSFNYYDLVSIVGLICGLAFLTLFFYEEFRG